MSVVSSTQLCGQYMERFGYHPKPNQLMLFAKQNGVKLLYKHCKQTILSIQSNTFNISHTKQIINSSQATQSEMTHVTQHKSLHNKCDDANSSQQCQLITSQNNENDQNAQQTVIDDELKEDDEKDISTNIMQSNQPNDQTVCKGVIPNNSTNSMDEIEQELDIKEDGDLAMKSSPTENDRRYQIVVETKYKLDIIIYIDSSTLYFSFNDYQKYLSSHYNIIVTPKCHFNHNMMVHFSPICHRLKTKLTEQQLSDDRINIIVFGFIRNTLITCIPSDIVFLMISYINDGNQKFLTPTHYEIREPPIKIYKYGLSQKYYCIPAPTFYSRRESFIPIKMSTGYHSKCPGIAHSKNKYKKTCNAHILPLKIGSISGIAPCIIDDNKEDIIDESLKYFRANVFKKTFEVQNSADLPLIYLTAFIVFSLNQLKDIKNKNDAINSKFYRIELNQKHKYCFKCPGDYKFPFAEKYYFTKPKSAKEKTTFIEYFKQLRGETLKRLINKCYYLNGLQNKHWFQFSHRKFLNITEFNALYRA